MALFLDGWGASSPLAVPAPDFGALVRAASDPEPLAPIVARGGRGWPDPRPSSATYAPLSQVLAAEYDWDAHFCAYSAPTLPHRLKSKLVDDDTKRTVTTIWAELEKLAQYAGDRHRAFAMVLLVADVDWPGHKTGAAPLEWRAVEDPKVAALLADAPGGRAYDTRGGYRVLYRPPVDQVMRSEADAAAWSLYYTGWLRDLRDRYQIHGDPACKDWTRLYRLPRVLRDGVPQRPRESGSAVPSRWPRAVIPDAAAASQVAAEALELTDEIPEAATAQLRARLQRHGPAISGSNGNKHTFSAAAICRAWGLSERGCLAELLWGGWNATCIPPWDAGELEDVVANAYNYGQGEPGEELSRWRTLAEVGDFLRSRPTPPEAKAEWGGPRPAPAGAFDPSAPPPVAAATASEPTPPVDPAAGAPAPATGARAFVDGPHQAQIVDYVEAELANDGDIFNVGGVVSRVVRNPVANRVGGGRWEAEAIAFEALRVDVVGRRFSISKRTDKGFVDQASPGYIPAVMMARKARAFPVLEAVVESPMFRADGSILETPGFDRGTAVYYEPNGVEFPRVPDRPTRDDAAAAVGELLEPFRDFPFVEACDRAAVLALILTLVSRPAIEGPVPMFGSGAPTAGSGKGLLMDAAGWIATGQEPDKGAFAQDDEELRKAFFALARAAKPFRVFDNLHGSIGSPVLDMVLTSSSITDRKLGESEQGTVPLRTVLAYTGNNILLRGDLARRIIPVDIDPGVERPEERTGFRYPNLLEYVRANRPRLVTRALLVLRAFHVVGRPAHGRPLKGSYEAWDSLVRACVVWACGVDPNEGVSRLRRQRDGAFESLQVLMTAWEEAFPEPVTAAEVVVAATGNAALSEALTDYASFRGKLEAKKLGESLSGLRGRVVDGRKFAQRDTKRGGRALWYLAR